MIAAALQPAEVTLCASPQRITKKGGAAMNATPQQDQSSNYAVVRNALRSKTADAIRGMPRRGRRPARAGHVLVDRQRDNVAGAKEDGSAEAKSSANSATKVVQAADRAVQRADRRTDDVEEAKEKVEEAEKSVSETEDILRRLGALEKVPGQPRASHLRPSRRRRRGRSGPPTSSGLRCGPTPAPSPPAGELSLGCVVPAG